MDDNNKAITVSATSSNEIRQKILECNREICRNYIEMGRLLKEVREKQLYTHWGYNSLSEYAEKELGFRSRKVYYLIEIYKFLDKHKLLGVYKGDMTKIYDLSLMEKRGIVTDDNLDEWIKKADELSRDKLQVAGKLASPVEYIRVSGYMSKEDYEFFKRVMTERFKKEFSVEQIGRAIAFLCTFYEAFNFNGTIDELRELIGRLDKIYRHKGVRIFFTKPVDDPAQMYDALIAMSAEIANIAKEYLPYKKPDERASFMMAQHVKSTSARTDKVRRKYLAMSKKLQKFKDFLPWKK